MQRPHNTAGPKSIRRRNHSARGGLRRAWGLTAVTAVALTLLAAVAWASLSTGVTGQKSWYWQNPEPQGNTLYGIAVAGDSDLWAVGGPGVVLHSTDSGTVWNSQDPGTLATLSDVDFVSTDTGWAVGEGGVIRSTTDGGDTWTSQSVEGTASDLSGLAMVDSDVGWVCGTDGTVRKTANGGATWVAQVEGALRLNDISAADTSSAWAVGQAGTILATTDGGSIWQAQLSANSFELNAVTFVDDRQGVAVGDSGTILKTVNGGTTWLTPVSIPTNENLTDVRFESANAGWAVGDEGSILVTTDGGDTWASVAGDRPPLRAVGTFDGGAAVVVGDRGYLARSLIAGQPWTPFSTQFADLYDLAFNGPSQGCAVGDAGTVLHTTDGGLTWTAVDSGTSAALRGVDCVESGKGWIVGAGGVIRTSVDATSWVGQSTPTSQTLYAVDFVDDDHGWIVGADGTVLHTTDGGSVSWEVTQSVPSEVETLYAVAFVDTQVGWAAGEGGTIIGTTNGGATWVVQSTPTSETLRGISFVDSLVGFASGDGGTVLKTEDGGASWDEKVTGAPASASLTGIRVNGSQVIVVGGTPGDPALVLRSSDAGETWVEQAPGTLSLPQAVRVVDSENEWIVGQGGMILRATDAATPFTTLTVDPATPDGANGWFLTRPIITLSSNEPGITFYSWYSENGPWKTYSSPVASAEGSSTFWYYSADPAANAETVQAVSVNYDATAPSTPTVSATADSSSTVTVRWDGATDAASGIDRFEVLSGGSVIATTTEDSLVVPGLETETEYSYTVRAYDFAGNMSAASDPVTVTTLSAFAHPASAVYARSMGPTSTAINWDDATATVEPVNYRVWRSVAGAPFSVIATVGPDVGRHLDTEAPRAQQLRYAISVVDGRGEGAMSAPSTYTTTGYYDLPAPVELTARNTASVTLTWSPSPLAAAYHVYRSTASTGTLTTLTAEPVAAATYLDESTAAYTEYWYSVASVDASDNVGTPSPRVYIRTYVGDASSTVDPPHGAYNTDTSLCSLCHATHTATSPISLLTGTTSNDAPLCLSCHDGTSASDVLSDYLDPGRTSRHAVPFDEISGDLNCTDCHGVHSSEQTETVRGLLRAGSAQSGNPFCYECHGENATAGARGDLRLFDVSAHGMGVVEPPTGTKVVCLSCHVSHTSREASLVPYSADDRCLGCHTQGLLAGGATDIAGALGGTDPSTRHDLRSSDSSETGSRIGCANCHEPHTSTATTPCVDPDRPTTGNAMSASGVALCLRCHDDALPTSEDTSGWAAAPLAAGGATFTVNVASSWETTAFHGAGDSIDPQLRPSMAEKGSELVCADCHDSHGSSNRFMLHESVGSLTGGDGVESLLVVPLAGGGADLRFFCDSCHTVSPGTHPAADLNQWPLDCTECHTHAGGGL